MSWSSAYRLPIVPVVVICDVGVFSVAAAAAEVVVMAVLLSMLAAVVVVAHVAACTLFAALFQMMSIVRTHEMRTRNTR
jgi:hypothetical protein